MRRLGSGKPSKNPMHAIVGPWQAGKPSGSTHIRSGLRSTPAPPDLDEGLRRFVEAVAAADTRERDGGWLGGIREYIHDSGPVPSSRFL